MLILSRVCADFYDKNHNLLHRITARDLGSFRTVPEAVKEDPLFQMLVDDGSIKYPADDARDKALEQAASEIARQLRIYHAEQGQ